MKTLIIDVKGSGKTLCYGLPIISQICYNKGLSFDQNENEKSKLSKKDFLKGLILCPTRELAL